MYHQGDKFRRLPSTHYREGEMLDANLHSMSIELEDIPQTTVSADDYLMSSQIGEDDLDIDIPNDDNVSICVHIINLVDVLEAQSNKCHLSYNLLD